MVILVPVDKDREPDPTIRVGADLARTYDDPLVVIHVMSEDEFELQRERRQWEYNLDKAMEDAARIARDVARATLDDETWEEIGRVGEPVSEILEEARRRDARYILARSRKRTPVGKAVFGSATQSLLLNADRPVVTVPDDLPGTD
jgi:nucleotide-binding universal stress UspA family protein